MKQSKKLIAITGGIGSGKSQVLKIISDLGYFVLSCDVIYKDLLNSGIFNEVFTKNFGNVFNNDGSLNNKKLAQIVFTDNNQLNLLNSLTHKAIITEVFRRASTQNCTCFVEVPLLFEGNLQDQFDEVMVVVRDVEERIKSVVKRDKISENDAKLRILRQFDYENADLSNYFIINNDGTLQDLYQKISLILSKIL